MLFEIFQERKKSTKRIEEKMKLIFFISSDEKIWWKTLEKREKKIT